MKICIIAQFPPPIHGLSKAVDTLFYSSLNKSINYLSNYDFEKVDIKCNKNFFSNCLKIFRSDADLFYLTISQSRFGNLRDLLFIKLLISLQRKCIIHLHGGYFRTLVDHDLPKWQKKINYSLIRQLEGCIVLSESLKSNFKGMIDDDKIFVVENCIDDNLLLDSHELIMKQGLLKNKKILHVLWLSNFIKSKGYPEVLTLACLEKDYILAGNEQRFHFDFAGSFFSDCDKLEFFKYVRENNLTDLITYHGIVSGKIKKEIIFNSDIFILPTRYPKEGQPISILEALANGLFIVTTDHAGIVDIVQNNINGFVLNKKDDLKDVFFNLRNMSNSSFCDFSNLNVMYGRDRFSQDKYLLGLKTVFDRFC